jgi:hypothetical protein
MVAAVFNLVLGLIGGDALPGAEAAGRGDQNAAAAQMADGEMAHMSGHMQMTMLRSPKADD